MCSLSNRYMTWNGSKLFVLLYSVFCTTVYYKEFPLMSDIMPVYLSHSYTDFVPVRGAVRSIAGAGSW